MIALLLALAPLAAQQTETMKVRPSTEADAVAEFEATCAANLFDYDGLRVAAAASRRGYVVENSDSGWRNWLSPYGTIHYLEGAPASVDTAPRCNLTSFTRAPVDRAALDAALRAMAKRLAARGYREGRGDYGHYWSWYDCAGRPMTAEVVLDSRTPQQIVLTLKPHAVRN